MYIGRFACCPLVSYGEYAEDETDVQTDVRQTVTLRFPLDAASVISEYFAPLCRYFLHVTLWRFMVVMLSCIV